MERVLVVGFVNVFIYLCVYFFKQKTAFEMRISDWSSDVCSSDLGEGERVLPRLTHLFRSSAGGVAPTLALRCRGGFRQCASTSRPWRVCSSTDRKSVA